MWSTGTLQGGHQGRPGTRDQGVDQPGVRTTTEAQFPEGQPKYEKPSSAAAEKAVRIIKGQVRTMAPALHARRGVRIPLHRHHATLPFSNSQGNYTTRSLHTVLLFGTNSEVTPHHRHGHAFPVANSRRSLGAWRGGKHALQHAPMTASSQRKL